MGMKPTGREPSDLKTSEEAAVWLQRLQVDDTPAARAEFFAWIAKAAANLEEFLFAQAIWKQMDHIDPEMRERLWSAATPDAVVDFPKREPVKIEALGPVGTTPRLRRPTRVAVVDGVVQMSPVHAAPLVRDGTLPSGAVEVNPAPIQLEAGDEADVDHGRVMKKARKTSIERAVSWRARRLMFQGDPVREIVEQFNRYNRTPIHLEGEEIQTRRMSGVFDADDPSPLIRYLERDPKIEVLKGADEILIRSR